MPALNYVKKVLPRAVHIKVYPQPQNVHETRTILRILKDFGEVDSFRSLRNDPIAPAPNTILAVFRHEESAARLIAEAPLQFDVQPRLQQPTEVERLSSILDDRSGSGAELSLKPNSRESREALGETQKTRQFKLTARMSTFDHQAHIQRQEYYWGYQSNQSSTQLALAQSVPTEALSNISTRQAQIPTRIVNKMMNEVTSRKSLRQLAEESYQVQDTAKGDEHF